ncbi:MAG: AMP-dependent synthetase/ligase [Acetivibrionales bacterium]|jgi:long-chain acyl-CoA synthetase
MKNIPLYEVRHINSLKGMLESSVKLFSNKAAFLVKNNETDTYEPITYKQFYQEVEWLGTAFIDMGLGSKRIALIAENRYEWAVSYLAAVNGTPIIVPIDKELPQNEIENLIRKSQASAVIFSGNKRDDILNISPNLDFVDFYIDMDADESKDNFLSFRELLEKGRRLVQTGDSRFKDVEIDVEAMRILLFTSATTDKSKAVMLCHRNICSNLMDMVSMTYIGPDDIFLSVLPLHHTYECTCGFLCPLYCGSAVAFCEGLRHIPKNLQQSKATVMLGVPLIFEAMYRRIWNQASKKPGMSRKLRVAVILSNFLRMFNINITKKVFSPIHDTFGGNIRLFVSGAAGIDPQVAKGFRDFGIAFIQGYGLTECSPIVALNRDVDFKDSSAGLPLPNIQIKIDKPDSEGVGEILVKGPSIMLGYYDSSVDNKKAFEGGWFHTGDLGYMDKEKFVYITGRKKNVIVTKNGKNIYPEEIETLLNRSPYIKECLVYGDKDPNSGDVAVSAEILPDMDYIEEKFKENIPSQQEIHIMIQNEIKAVNKSLVIYKHIKHFNLREDEFAKTTTKKIKRYLEINK